MFGKDVRVSPAVQKILDDLLRRQGDVELTAEEAQNMYGGSLPCKVSECSKVELLQIALLEAYTVMASNVKPNRRARRANERAHRATAG